MPRSKKKKEKELKKICQLMRNLKHSPHFLKKKKKRNTHFQIRWNKNIRLENLSEASKLMIGPFRSYIVW